ncbi:Protein FAR1-RELATED SEQUENCE 5 [Acorus calamus]|uniref:Protein FAR1-RELATED SEQUENCE 5 n=1 Tax=Acorus calamus TaxID=4465 RepID=A0AAV9C6P9_ACOCL|nr:Protein FAR1-RELATED SEQUENCE 5 [Acorus calamus]
MEHTHVVAAPSKVHYVLPEAYANMDPFVGMEFESDEAAKAFYMVYAGRLGFATRIRRSCRLTRDDSFILRRFVCTKEGYDSREDNGGEGSNKKQKHGSIREGCEAMIEVVRKDPEKWVISKVVNEHCHPLGTPNKVSYVQS